MKIRKIMIVLMLLLVLIFPAHAHAGLWDNFVNWVDKTIETVVDTAKDVSEAVVSTAEEITTNIIEFVVETGDWIYETENTLVEQSLNFFFGAAEDTVTLLSYFGLEVDISHWFSTGVHNSEDTAQLWRVEDYDNAANDPVYLAEFRQRQADYIANLNLSEDDENKNSHRNLRAYLGLSLDEAGLADKLAELWDPSRHAYKNPDMALIELIRIVADSDDYDDMILEGIADLPYWQNEDEEGRCVYTSENHVLMWLSTSWLLYELEGWEVGGEADVTRERLVRYLEVKNQYGMYESTSRVYSPFSLTALLNLYDYSQDDKIKELAGKAAVVLLNDIVMVTNDAGVPLSVDSRAYEGGFMRDSYMNTDYARYASMVTGLGDEIYEGGTKLDILAMTDLDVSCVINNRRNVLGSEVNISYKLGHSINDIDKIWEGLSQQDKVIFAQSGGAYGHPEVLDDMLDVYLDPLAGLNFFMEDLIQEADLADDLIDMSGVLLTKTSAPFTTSSIIMEKTMDLYRHGNVQLSSLQNYHPGNAGWQQQPWVATAGYYPVYTRSGAQYGGWKAGGQEQMNTHLPHIQQNKNVALILYKPAMELRFMDGVVASTDFLPVDDFLTAPVNLYWPEEYFDETAGYGNWLFGREGDGYVAVYRHCADTKIFEDDGEIVEIYSCSEDEQVWAAVVGDSETHGSFINFIFTMSEAKLKSKWYWSWAETRHVWKTTLEVDGVTISYAWEANVDDLTDSEMWELAGVTGMKTIETAQIGGYKLTGVDDNLTSAGFSNCASGSDILLHQNVSYLGTDPAVLRMWEDQDKVCHVVNKEDQSADLETIHAGEDVDIVAFKNYLFSGGEADKVANVSHEWTTVDLNFSYTNPVVFASVIDVAGSDPVVTEVRNITATSFEVRVAEFEWSDGEHLNFETIHYVVMEAGTYTLAHGVTMDVGAVLLETKFDGTPDFETVGVDLQDYLLVSQIQGKDLETVMDTRIDNKQTGSFDISLMVQEADQNSGRTIQAVVGYMAVGKQAVTSKKISLKSAHGTFLRAVNNGGSGETANFDAMAVGDHEIIVITGDSTKQGCMVNGDKVWLQTTKGYYYSAQPNGDLDVDRTKLGSYETFELINHTSDTACMQNGDVISLYSTHDTYMVAENTGKANANRENLGSWEKFIVFGY
ncbi:MAG: hypothetical protein GY718_04850 [Lentisphaerae bacterium]|nr:hypothetical protein [Lentisphaerota bacterium]